jgi:hypothetical protein
MIARFPIVSPAVIASLHAKGELIENLYSDEVTAIKASGEMLWSPDGRYLAYTGLFDGLVT